MRRRADRAVDLFAFTFTFTFTARWESLPWSKLWSACMAMQCSMDVAGLSGLLNATVLSTADRCLACGAEPAAGEKLLKCRKCLDRQLPGGYYCSPACQKADWKNHKEWHRAQDMVSERLNRDGPPVKQSPVEQSPVEQPPVEQPPVDQFLHHAYYIRLLDPSISASEAGSRAKCQLAHSKPPGDLVRLLNKAAASRDQGDLSKAVRYFNKAIAHEPLSPYGYDGLADVHARAHNGLEAATAYMQAMDRYPTCSMHWAKAAASAFDIMNRPLKGVRNLHPSWWNDESLKTLSSLVVQATRPDECNVSPSHRASALAMRGEVLSCIAPPRVVVGKVGLPQWTLGTRTPQEVREGGEHYQAAANTASNATFPVSAMKEGFVIAALACFKRSKEQEAADAAACSSAAE